MSIAIGTVFTFVMALMKTSFGQDVKNYFGGTKPKVMSRRFVGSVIALVGVIATTFHVDIPQEILTQATDNIWAIISAGGMLYGVALNILGVIKAKKGE